MMVAIRTLFYEQAIKMEANIKSQCRQADEWWAQVEAIDAILGKREDEDVVSVNDTNVHVHILTPYLPQDKGKEKALDEVHHPTTSDV
jgi:hypothetical protein